MHAAEMFSQIARHSVAKKGWCAVTLSGGSTPKALYSRLASERFQREIPWRELHLFWGDERYVPADDVQNNYRMAWGTLISKVPVPEKNIYRIPVETGPAEDVAREYEENIRTFFNLARGEAPSFDLVLLGMGEDGHTASLFPGTSALQESTALVTANYVAKLRAQRVTLTFRVLNHAAHIIFLVAGEGKAVALRRVLQDESANLPAQMVRPVNGTLLWIVDQAAASKLGHL